MRAKHFFIVLLIGLVLISFNFILVKPAFAQITSIFNPVEGIGDVGGIISKLMPFVFTLAAMIALLFLIWGGFKYMLAQGDPKQIDAARGTVVSAIIGLAIVLAIYAIFQVVEAVFRISILGQIVGPVYAQGVDIGQKFDLATKFDDLGDFFTNIVRIALIGAALVFFMVLVWSGFNYINSGGNQENVEKARNSLTSAGIGLLIVVLSLVIIEVATSIFGIGSIFGL